MAQQTGVHSATRTAPVAGIPVHAAARRKVLSKTHRLILARASSRQANGFHADTVHA
ncbi:hypothetical protein LHK_00338 [Laribacter hongkongensis HLHK9]|uniref:Uncharacterized protein n=1 Tax=Laribacter hongkongensis (strain HLHK9) TaxID=557598 RepID=C1DBD6_LARHH|nr:hypothetical protein LHK_00338 [Laribacter hongkongensis HLHK9]